MPLLLSLNLAWAVEAKFDCQSVLEVPPAQQVAFTLKTLSEMPSAGAKKPLIQKWQHGKEELKEHLENGEILRRVLHTPEGRAIFRNWVDATAQIKTMEQHLEKMTAAEQKLFRPVLWAAISAVTSHAVSWTEIPVAELDFMRIRHILEEIKTFDVAKPKFSFFRLQRMIEGRYSLAEFIHCRAEEHDDHDDDH